MPQKSNHNFKGIYPYIRVSTLVAMRIKDTLTKTAVCLLWASVLEYKKTYNDIKRGKADHSCKHNTKLFKSKLSKYILFAKDESFCYVSE